MAVVVVPSDADQRGAGADPGEELRIEPGRSVMRDLEHVGGRETLPQQPCLRLRLDVAAEQGGPRRPAHVHHDADIVDLRALSSRVLRRGSVGRADHRELGRAEPPSHPRPRRPFGDPATGEVTGQPDGLPLRSPSRTDQYGAHRTIPEDTLQTADVVEVRMGQHDQRHLPDLHGPQAPIHQRGIGPGVHHHRPPLPRRHQQRVSLPDVAGHHQPPPGRPAGRDRSREDGRGQHSRHHGGEDPARPPVPQRHEGDRRGDGQQGQAGDAAGPREDRQRNPGRVPRDLDDPAGGQARRTDQKPGHRHQHRRDQCGGESEDGRRGDGGTREEIGGNRHRIELPGHEDQDGGDGDLRGGRNGDRLGGPAGHPPGHPVPPPRGEQQDAPGGAHRKGEAGRTGELGIEQDQPEDGRRQGRHTITGAAGAERHGGDGAHEKGAEHAGRGAGDDGEGDHREHRGHRPDRERQPGRPRQHHRGPGHDRQVGSAHGQQMAEPRLFEIGSDLLVHPGQVAGDQTGQQAALSRGQHLRRLPQPGPEFSRDALRPGRPAQDTR
ncbi:hypothetical protein Pta02_05810 [Planobispora takensis]|uniref:Uncharacterized protein n=1 Tax=Planobispora takensis TaxID=1367882 RepID=A0A8J3SQS0_9ACTN|nr:hypothetical protein Pta02_05810 [Planobispora takensis]